MFFKCQRLQREIFKVASAVFSIDKKRESLRIVQIKEQSNNSCSRFECAKQQSCLLSYTTKRHYCLNFSMLMKSSTEIDKVEHECFKISVNIF